jgi:hypothetical protein
MVTYSERRVGEKRNNLNFLLLLLLGALRRLGFFVIFEGVQKFA